MLNFFRKIRLSLMPGQGQSKYLKYAIGEILLVVIGILIALQINNWSSRYKDGVKEAAILNELKLGLEADRNILQKDLERHQRDYNMLLELDSLLELPSFSQEDRLSELFGRAYGIRFTRLNNAFYEDLKSSGLHILKNNSIRLKIVNLFELRYKYIAGLYNSESSVNEVIRPYYLENFSNLEFTESAEPINFDKVWTDPKYKNIIHYRIINLKSNHLNAYPPTIQEISILIDEIEAYLGA